jgi:hypothetical protein
MAHRKKVRPSLPASITEGVSTAEEAFQNRVLRSIIKMQSDLLMAHIGAQLNTLHVAWDQLEPIKKKEALTGLLTKNQLFKSEVVGMVVGQFELAEHEEYIASQREYNKRITQIVLNRAIDILI